MLVVSFVYIGTSNQLGLAYWCACTLAGVNLTMHEAVTKHPAAFAQLGGVPCYLRGLLSVLADDRRLSGDHILGRRADHAHRRPPAAAGLARVRWQG